MAVAALLATLPQADTANAIAHRQLVNDPGSSLNAALGDAGGYTVGSASSATVAVADDDEPRVSLPGTAEAALSNGVVTVERPSGWTGSGRIQFGGGPTKSRDRANFTTLQVANVNDDTFEVTWASRTAGTQQLTLEWQPIAGSSWQPSDGDAQDPRVLTIEDPRSTATPEITISGGSGITEGGTATFTISASPAPDSPITVNVGVRQSGSWGASGAATVSVSGASTTYTVTTSDDQVDEADGSVTATLQAGQGYTIGAASSATVAVAVADDDLAPGAPAVDFAMATDATMPPPTRSPTGRWTMTPRMRSARPTGPCRVTPNSWPTRPGRAPAAMQ